MSALHNTISQDGFPTNQWDSDTRTKTSVGRIVNPVLGLNEQMFQLVLGNEGLGKGVEAADDVRADDVAGFGPGQKVVRRSTIGSADLQESAEGSDNFRITLTIG